MGVCDEEMPNMLRRLWPGGAFERAVAIFFAMILLALGIASFAEAALTYDGSFVFFRLLETHQFIYDFDRVLNLVVEVPVMVATHLTENVHILGILLSAGCCSIPILGLAVSWLVCRDHPSLLIWPAMSIGLASLPGEFFFFADPIMVATLFWPALLTVLVGASPTTLGLVAILTILAAATHPAATAFSAAIALCALAAAIRRPRLRQRSLWFALFLALIFLERMLIPLSDYERGAITSQIVTYTFARAIYGWPLVALGLIALAALGCIFPRRSQSVVVVIVPLIAAGGALVAWALNPANWVGCIDYRYWTTPITLAFMGGAAIEGLWLPRSSERLLKTRTYAILLVGGIFLVVLSIQSIEWQQMNLRMREELVNSGQGCVAFTSLDWLRDTALNHWGAAFNAIEVQGRRPDTLLLPHDLACHMFVLNRSALLVSQGEFVYQRGINGWFDFSTAYDNAKQSYTVP
jgi:hypothetical protein